MIKANRIYRHFKGGFYLVLNVARSEENGEELVVYQSLKDDAIWTRPLEDFSSVVPSNKENPTGQEHRFERMWDFDNRVSAISTEKLMEELLGRKDCPSILIAMSDYTERIFEVEYHIGYFRDTYISPEEGEVKRFHTVLMKDTEEEALSYIRQRGGMQLTFLKVVKIKQDLSKTGI